MAHPFWDVAPPPKPLTLPKQPAMESWLAKQAPQYATATARAHTHTHQLTHTNSLTPRACAGRRVHHSCPHHHFTPATLVQAATARKPTTRLQLPVPKQRPAPRSGMTQLQPPPPPALYDEADALAAVPVQLMCCACRKQHAPT